MTRWLLLVAVLVCSCGTNVPVGSAGDDDAGDTLGSSVSQPTSQKVLRAHGFDPKDGHP